MASLGREGDNTRIQFVGLDGRRRSLRLGKIADRLAAKHLDAVERLLEAAKHKQPTPADVQAWLAGLSEETFARYVTAGLTVARAKRRPERLAAYCDSFIASRGDLKPRTLKNLDQTRKKLVEYFGLKKRLDEVTLADAARYARWLESPDGAKLAPNTARRLLGRAKQIFTVAVDDELLTKNPFRQKAVKCSQTGNPDRLHFVTEEVALKVLDACPSMKWKLIFALGRWGGLRIPSETLGLRWGDVQWGDGVDNPGRIRVTSPKLEHHEGNGERWVPMFPELRPLLEQAFDAAEPGTEFVIAGDRNSQVNYHGSMRRIIEAAGLTPWEKLFQNLRSTRATELKGRGWAAHVVAKWLGHSVEVAREHYDQVPDEYFTIAARGGSNSGSLYPGLRWNGVESSSQRIEKTRISASCSPAQVPLKGSERRS